MSDEQKQQAPVPYEQYQHQLEAVAEASAAQRIAEQQRDFLGDQVRRRVERFHALRVVHGEIDAGTMMQACQQEVGLIHQHLQSMEAKPDDGAGAVQPS